jgi:hypothetical protein
MKKIVTDKLIGCGYEVTALIDEGQSKTAAYKVFNFLSQAFSVEMHKYEKWSNCDPIDASDVLT